MIIKNKKMMSIILGSVITLSYVNFGVLNVLAEDPVALESQLQADGSNEVVHSHILKKCEKVEPTCTETGNSEYWQCTVEGCNKRFAGESSTEEKTRDDFKLEATGHDMQHVDSREATCIAEGRIEHYHCNNCNKNFRDNAGNEELDKITIPKSTAHAGSVFFIAEKLPIDCEGNGNIAYYQCLDCLKTYLDAEGTIPVDDVIIPAHSLKKVYSKKATCTEDGYIEHWNCEKCGKCFEDQYGTREISNDKLVILKTGHVEATYKAAKEPTKTTAGNHEYWVCPDCERMFLDEALTEEADYEQDILIPLIEIKESREEKNAVSELTDTVKPAEETKDVDETALTAVSSEVPATGESNMCIMSGLMTMLIAGMSMIFTFIETKFRKKKD